MPNDNDDPISTKQAKSGFRRPPPDVIRHNPAFDIMQSIFSPAARPRKTGERRGILKAAAVG